MFAICKQETLLSRCHACANQHSGNKFCQALVSPTGHLSLSRCLPCPGSLDLEVTRTGDHTDVCWHSENQLTVHWEQLLPHTCLSEMPFPHQDEAWSWSLWGWGVILTTCQPCLSLDPSPHSILTLTRNCIDGSNILWPAAGAKIHLTGLVIGTKKLHFIHSGVQS